MFRGQVVKWNDEKGFGFIKAPGLASDTFVHISELKHMNRPPKEGDFIHFDIEKVSGKSRAVKARIEGVKYKSHQRVKKPNHGVSKVFISIALIAGVSLFAFDNSKSKVKVQQEDSGFTQVPSSKNESDDIEFSCDGRQYCSQMTSLREAKFFIKNCPNTKMDGDGDGKPCENDSRF